MKNWSRVFWRIEFPSKWTKNEKNRGSRRREMNKRPRDGYLQGRSGDLSGQRVQFKILRCIVFAKLNYLQNKKRMKEIGGIEEEKTASLPKHRKI